MSFKFDLQLFGGGGSSTTVNESKYTPSEYELQLQKAQANYADAIAPNSLWLNDTARNVLQNSLGTVQVDYNKLNQNAQNQISGAQNGITNLQNGQLPQSYLDNMSDAIRSGVTNTVGQNINDLGNRGVLNSSVTGQAMNDIEKNVSNTMAQQYTNNISQLSNLYNNQINSATAGTTAAAAAQEAAQQPALNLWNASIGLNGTTTGALAAAAGKGTTTNTATTSGGSSGLLGGLLGGIL